MSGRFFRPTACMAGLGICIPALHAGSCLSDFVWPWCSLLLFANLRFLQASDGRGNPAVPRSAGVLFRALTDSAQQGGCATAYLKKSTELEYIGRFAFHGQQGLGAHPRQRTADELEDVEQGPPRLPMLLRSEADSLSRAVKAEAGSC